MLVRRYFHNWTGNRVTCRDWFQLTLKEGLTVFRDQVRITPMHPQPWLPSNKPPNLAKHDAMCVA